MNYQNFSSKISFYEFIQDEYYAPNFKINKYKDELKALKGTININSLSDIFKDKPRVFDIFEQFFQLSRFNNTQYINFLFDVSLLNNADLEMVANYSHKSIEYYGNGKLNEHFTTLLRRYGKEDTSKLNLEEYVSRIKRCIPEYVDKCIKNKAIFYEHISNSLDVNVRTTRYLIEVLNADEYCKSIDIEKYLELKRIPKDNKNLHGNFGTIKISKILKEKGLKDVSKSVGSVLDYKCIEDLQYENICYAKEKYISGIRKRKDKRAKKFDFVIINNKKPIILIETNFYSTMGTKIGINIGEYTDLLEDISKFNLQKSSKLQFIWITDGNYWLTQNGESNFNNLVDYYFKTEPGLLNYKLFAEYLEETVKDLSK